MTTDGVVIFGAGRYARIVRAYLRHDSPWTVAAYTAHSRFVDSAEFDGLPFVGFEEIEHQFPPADFAMFVAVGYRQVNKPRRAVYEEAKRKGYRLITYVSSRAVVVDDVAVGDNCLILEGNVLQPGARIGNDVVLWSGNHIGHDVVIGDHSFLSSHIVIGGHATIGDSCFVGMNATIRDGIKVAADCVIGAGAMIMRDAPAGAVYIVRGTPIAPIKSDELGDI